MTGPTRDRGSGLFWWVIVGGLVAIVAGVAFTQRFGTDPDLVDSPLIGTALPSVTIPLLETPGEFDLGSLEGEIAVINFWASWCTGCRQEHAALVAAASGYDEFGVTFVGINYQDSTARALGFLDELGRSPETIYLEDDRSRAALEFGVLGLPETFFVDRDGTIVGKVSGPMVGSVLTDTLDKIILGESVGTVKVGEVENRE
jgi:cytochrome c biogenesis protein CcmG/thiol:disulfide interchange protein DsbE